MENIWYIYLYIFFYSETKLSVLWSGGVLTLTLFLQISINLAVILFIVFSSDTLILFLLWYISYILVLNEANSEVIVNSDKSFYEHCLHSNKLYSIVLSLIVSDDIKESTIKFFFIWYHAQGEHFIRRISFSLPLNSDITFWEIYFLICESFVQNCVIKIHSFVIIKKGEIVRTNLVLHIYL